MDANFDVEVGGEIKYFHRGCVNHMIREHFKK